MSGGFLRGAGQGRASRFARPTPHALAFLAAAAALTGCPSWSRKAPRPADASSSGPAAATPAPAPGAPAVRPTQVGAPGGAAAPSRGAPANEAGADRRDLPSIEAGVAALQVLVAAALGPGERADALRRLEQLETAAFELLEGAGGSGEPEAEPDAGREERAVEAALEALATLRDDLVRGGDGGRPPGPR